MFEPLGGRGRILRFLELHNCNCSDKSDGQEYGGASGKPGRRRNPQQNTDGRCKESSDRAGKDQAGRSEKHTRIRRERSHGIARRAHTEHQRWDERNGCHATEVIHVLCEAGYASPLDATAGDYVGIDA